MNRHGAACLWNLGGAGRRFALVALCVTFLIALGVGTASAAYVEVGSFAGSGSGPGGSGSGNGELSNPGQADVNDATGNLYVADTGNNRVEVFKPTATAAEYDSQIAVTAPTGLAIDQSDGSVYVATASGTAKYDAALSPVGAGWTDPGVTGALAVDPATGDLLVADTGANLVRRFNSDGSADGTFAAQRPIDLAANSAGDVFVVTTTGNIGAYPCGSTSAVERFSEAGTSEGTLAGLTVPGAVAVDPDNDGLLIATHVNEYFCERGNRPAIAFLDAAGNLEGTLALLPDTMYAAVPALAASGGGSSRAYAITKSPQNDSFGATRGTVLEIPPPAPPVVKRQSALPGREDATLRATIQAGGLATEYRFEYGPTSTYGQVTATGTLVASFAPATARVAISGLLPGATYHYRVAARNSLGEAVGPDRTFTTKVAATCPNEAFRTGASAHLTDCRAYELVTPIGSEADIRFTGGPVTPDGSAACFQTEDRLLDSQPNGIKSVDDGFCSWLTASGWETKWVTGPASRIPFNESLGGFVHFISADGRRVVFSSDGNLLGDDFVSPEGDRINAGTMSAYMWEGGKTTWLAPAGAPVGDPPEYPIERFPQRRALAVTADLSQGIFESNRRLLSADQNDDVDLYEWNPSGLRLISVDPAGKAAGGRAIPKPFSPQSVAAPGQFSADGSRVFFHHGGAPLAGDASEAPEGTVGGEAIQSVYLREGDQTMLVSPRRGSGPNSSVWFVGATADGGVAYLETMQRLTPEAKEFGTAIYRYDVETDQLELVADALGGVQFLALSSDGSTIVYRERLSSQLVVDREGVPTTLGKFVEADVTSEQGAGSSRSDGRMLRVTPDGRVVVFAAAGEFAGFGPGPIQVYRWEAGKGLERISGIDGAEAESSASIGAYAALIGSDREDIFGIQSQRAQTGRAMSDDGSRVFFETRDALVNRDVNNATDVYEWHNGEIDIVSDGTGGNSFYHGNSADGRTVFITTFDRLLPEWDHNAKRDLYVARPGGGFPPPPSPPGCAGEACQPGRAAPAPNSAGKASGADELTRGLAGVTLRKSGKLVRVKVLVPGRVTATLKGKLGKGKPVVVAKASKVARTAGTIALRLKLNRKARSALAKRGTLHLTLTVRHVASGQTITRKVTFHG